MYKLYILLSAALLMTACSDDTTDNFPSNTLEMGQTSIVTKEGTPLAADAWTWKDGDVLTASANGLSSTYTYTTTWNKGNNANFTKEAIGLNEITLSFGNNSLTNDQATAANYRKADYLTGKGILNHLTINGTLTHQHTDVVVTFTKGDGWTSDKEFDDAIAAASFKINSNIIPFHDKATFRAVVPPANVPSSGALGTLTFGATPAVLNGRTAQVVYTHNYSAADLTGTRLTVTVTLNVDCSVSATIEFKLWDKNTISEPFPAE